MNILFCLASILLTFGSKSSQCSAKKLKDTLQPSSASSMISLESFIYELEPKSAVASPSCSDILTILPLLYDALCSTCPLCVSGPLCTQLKNICNNMPFCTNPAGCQCYGDSCTLSTQSKDSMCNIEGHCEYNSPNLAPVKKCATLPYCQELGATPSCGQDGGVIQCTGAIPTPTCSNPNGKPICLSPSWVQIGHCDNQFRCSDGISKPKCLYSDLICTQDKKVKCSDGYSKPYCEIPQSVSFCNIESIYCWGTTDLCIGNAECGENQLVYCGGCGIPYNCTFDEWCSNDGTLYCPIGLKLCIRNEDDISISGCLYKGIPYPTPCINKDAEPECDPVAYCTDGNVVQCPYGNLACNNSVAYCPQDGYPFCSTSSAQVFCEEGRVEVKGDPVECKSTSSYLQCTGKDEVH